MKYEHSCFGSKIIINTYKRDNIDLTITSCFDLLDAFEDKYSRFRSWNLLDTINTKKSAVIDDELVALIRLSLQVSELSQWYFDITMLPLLEKIGYGIWNNTDNIQFGYENIILQDNTLTLKNGVSIELGAVGKWYMVDVIYKILDPLLEKFVIDFWWDIRVKWQETIELEDPNDTTKMLGTISIQSSSIASSAGNKRVFWKTHHLLNPKTQTSQNDKKALYVTHALASFADIFSTALFVSPLDIAIKMLEETKGLEGMIIWNNGKIYTSAWFQAILNTQ